MIRRGVAAVLVALAVILVLGAAVLWDRRVDGVLTSRAITLHQVTRGGFLRTTLAEGLLEAVQATPITVPVEAPGVQRIAWTVEDGSQVRAGEVVIRFDPTEMERDLADGLDAQTRTELEILRTRTDNETRRGNLLLDAEQAERESLNAEQFASRDAEVFSRHDIIDSEIDRELAHTTARTSRERAELFARQGTTAVELLEIEKAKASLKVSTARTGLRSLAVTAPHDGLLVLERDWRGDTVRPGDEVWPGRKLAEIPDPASMQARVYVLESEAGGLAAGLTASLVVEAHPDRRFPARIERVDALAKPRDWGVPVQYFEVVIRPEQTDPAIMKPGQRVRAEIVLEDRDDALTVPRQAVFEKDGRRVVYRREGGHLVPVEVTVGSHSLSRVVVEDGLAEGDRVALRDPTREPGRRHDGEENAASARPAVAGVGS